MQTEFNNGATYCKDLVLATILGFQNEKTYLNVNDPKYQILQELYEFIEKTYGKAYTPFKG